MGLTLQLESVGCCYWGGGKVLAIFFSLSRYAGVLCRQVNVLIFLNGSEE